jgi:predicted nucleic acid-binding protein
MVQRIYVDSSVLVYFFISNLDPKFSKKSKDFLERVESGKYEGTISLFALMELVKQLRELLVRANICSPADWDVSIKKALEKIYKMPNIKIVEGTLAERKQSLTPFSLSHSEIAWDSFDIMNKYQGSVKIKSGNYEHDGLHPIDAVHVTLAKRMGCVMIATFDRDFKETNGEITPLLLQDDTF